MKRILFFLTTIAAASALFFSCQRQEDNLPASRSEIKFSASVGTFALKATDNALEAGDALGVYAMGTTSFENRRMVWDGKSLVPDAPVYWDVAQGEYEKCPFGAYYPYQEGMNTDNYVFSVRQDQSTHAAYTASDFMTAYTEASPSDGMVEFQLYHMLSKIIIRIDNKLGVDIADVYMGGVARNLEFKEGESYSPSGDYDTVRAGKVTLSDGSVAWTLIVVYGSSYPVLKIVAKDRTEYTYQVPNGVYLYSGCCYTADVTLSENAELQAVFNANVGDWWNEGEFWFNGHQYQPEYHPWSVIGTINGTMWDVDFPMERYDLSHFGLKDEYWITRIDYHAGEEFKFRRDYDWSVNLGGDNNFTDVGGGMLYLDLYQGGPNIILPESGLWDLTINVTSNTLTATHQEQSATLIWTTSLSEQGIPTAYNRLAYKTVSGEALLISDGEKVNIVSPDNGEYWGAFFIDGIAPASIDSDDAGNIIIANDVAADMDWNTGALLSGTELTVYATSDLQEFKKITLPNNVYGTVGGFRARGDISTKGAITGFAGSASYWIGFDMANFEAVANYYGTENSGPAAGPNTVWNPTCAACIPYGNDLHEGVLYRGYDGAESVWYRRDAYTPSWAVGDAYEPWTLVTNAGAGGNENQNNMDVIDYKGRKILAFTQGYHFTWSGFNADIYVLDITDIDAPVELATISTGDWILNEWPNGAASADVLLHIGVSGLELFAIHSGLDTVAKFQLNI